MCPGWFVAVVLIEIGTEPIAAPVAGSIVSSSSLMSAFPMRTPHSVGEPARVSLVRSPTLSVPTAPIGLAAPVT
jgi:hypothetical protein